MGSEGKDEVILYNHPVSHYGQRVEIALHEKGIAFRKECPDLRNKPKELLEVNPIYGKIPAMKHNGNAIVESLIILEYLDDAWPETWQLLPKNPVERAHARFWADFIYKGWKSMMDAMIAAPGSSEKAAAAEEIKKFLKTVDEQMTKSSKAGPFFNGPEFGYLDVVLAPLLCWSRVVEKGAQLPMPGPEESPRLCKWMKNVATRKSVKEALPPGDEVADFYIGIKKKREAESQAAAAPAS